MSPRRHIPDPEPTPTLAPASDVMTVSEVAHYLKVSTAHVQKQAQQKKLPGIQIGNRWRFHRSRIEALLREV